MVIENINITQEVLSYLLPYISQHGIIISFLIGFITGETFIIILAFLSATGTIPLWYVVIFCTLGMYLSDFVPFTIGKSRLLSRLFKVKNKKATKKLEDKFLKYTHNNLFLALFYTKFIYGLSIPALIYFGHKGVSYKKFALYNVGVELIFVPIVVSVGWLAGKGFTYFLTAFRNIKLAIFLLIFLIIIVYFIRTWLDKRLIKKQKLLN